VPDDLPILLDGAEGDGGGQRLRTALALACITGRPFSAVRFRAARPEPGLRAAHLQAAHGAAVLCDAVLVGAEPGSPRLDFTPRRAVRPVDGLELDAGAAGSTGLLLQTVCWPLALAGAPSTLVLRGGTHQPQAPSFHDLALVWGPAVARLGFTVEVSLQVAGFLTGGGGQVSARIEPAHAMPPFELHHRGTLREVEVLSFSGGSEPSDLQQADRQASRAVRALRARGVPAEAERLPLPVQGSAGSHLLLVASFERTRSGHGAVVGREPGGADPAEAAVAAFGEHLTGGGAVEAHLADQLLLPAALLAAGLVPPAAGVVPASRWSVGLVTQHLLDGAMVIPRFLDVEVSVLGRLGEPGEVRVQPRGAGLELAALARHP
jgi:RNA 3'-terminal phosphate cyclase (ATP)